MSWWVLQNVMIAGILAVLVQIVCRLGRVGPVGRHALWLIVLVKIVTPPVVVLHSPWKVPLVSALMPRAAGTFEAQELVVTGDLNILPRVPSAATPGDPAPIAQSMTVTGSLDFVSRPSHASAPVVTGARVVEILQRLLSYSMGIWMAGAIVFALVQSVRIRRVLRSLRRAVAASPSLAEEVETLARRLGTGPIWIRVVPDLASPLIWSLNPFSPQLLWPRELPLNISDDSHRALIVHELAHVKRRDHWIGWLELAAGCVAWWNPLFWYVRLRLRENAELACDGWVVNEMPHGRRAYADAVLAMCARITPASLPVTVAGVSTGGRRLLERRLAMIMQDRIPLRLSRAAVLSVVALTLIALPAWAQRIQHDPVGVNGRVVGVDQTLPAIGQPSMAERMAPSTAKRVPRITLEPAQNQAQQPVSVPAPDMAVGQRPSLPTPASTSNGSAVLLPLSLDDALKAGASRNADPTALRNAYWDLVYATERVESAQESLAMATKLVEGNAAKVEIGTLAPLDIVSARASQAQRQQVLASAEGNRRTSELALKRLIVTGTDDPDWTKTIDPTDRASKPVPIDLPAAIRRALGPDRAVDPRNAALLAERRSTELQIAQDVTQAAITLLNSGDAVRAAEITRIQSEQQLADVQRKFEAGESTNYTVVQYQRDLADARVSELRAMLNYRKAEVAFQQLQESGPSDASRPAR